MNASFIQRQSTPACLPNFTKVSKEAALWFGKTLKPFGENCLKIAKTVIKAVGNFFKMAAIKAYINVKSAAAWMRNNPIQVGQIKTGLIAGLGTAAVVTALFCCLFCVKIGSSDEETTFEDSSNPQAVENTANAASSNAPDEVATENIQAQQETESPVISDTTVVTSPLAAEALS